MVGAVRSICQYWLSHYFIQPCFEKLASLGLARGKPGPMCVSRNTRCVGVAPQGNLNARKRIKIIKSMSAEAPRQVHRRGKGRDDCSSLPRPRYSPSGGGGVERGTVSRRGELLECRMHETGFPPRSLRRALPPDAAAMSGEGLQSSGGLAEDVLAAPGALGWPGAGAAQAELDGRGSRPRLGTTLHRGGRGEASGGGGATPRREPVRSARRDRRALGSRVRRPE